MHAIVPLGNNSPLALREDSRLSRDIRQPSNDLLVTIYKPIQSIRYLDFVAEILDQLLRLAQIVPRNSWIQVVDRLELQPAMEEVEPLWTVNIHGSTQHLLRKGLMDAEISGAHREVRQSDLDMKR